VCIDDDVWALDSDQAFHWDTSLTWSSDYVFSGSAMTHLWFGAFNGWATSTGGTIYRWSGNWADFGQPLGSAGVYGVHGVADTDVWAVGKSALVGHFDGTSWTTKTNPATGDLRAVWAVATDDVWFVGGTLDSSATILHWNGSTFATSTPPADSPPYSLAAVWASGSNDVWAVGSDSTAGPSARGGILVHWDGAAWTYVPSPSPNLSRLLTTVWGFSPSDIWVGGQDYDQNLDETVPLLLHFDGTAWSKVDGVTSPIAGIWGKSTHDVWAVGSAPTAFHFDGTTWTPIPIAAATHPFVAIYGR
jgi:hypothetical protein